MNPEEKDSKTFEKIIGLLENLNNRTLGISNRIYAISNRLDDIPNSDCSKSNETEPCSSSIIGRLGILLSSIEGNIRESESAITNIENHI